MLSKASDGVSPSSRIHSPTYSLTFSVRRNPRHSILDPAKSMGMDLVIVEKLLALLASRSSRTDHLPPWMIFPSITMVSGGPPVHPRGEAPLCSASKLSIDASSEPELTFCAKLDELRAIQIKAV